MLTPIEADRHLAALLKERDARTAPSVSPHWSHDSGACFELMAKEGCYPFMTSHAGGGTTVTIGGVGQPFTIRTDFDNVATALRYCIVLAVIHKLELAGVRAPQKINNKANLNNQTSYTAAELIALVEATPGIARGVDADLNGRTITDYDALLWGACAPAVVRIVNLALTRCADKAPAPITADELRPIAAEAIGQATDYNFAKPPQVMSDYSILIRPGEYTYHDHVLTLVNLALKKLGSQQ
jgi:hypothetical protein